MGNCDTVDVFDRNDFMARLGDDEELFQEIIELFLEEIPGQLNGVEQAVNSGDASALAANAHQLKGACANLSATRAAEAASQLEITGKSGDMTRATDQLDTLKNEMHSLMAILQG